MMTTRECPDCDGKLIRARTIIPSMICMECGTEWKIEDLEDPECEGGWADCSFSDGSMTIPMIEDEDKMSPTGETMTPAEKTTQMFPYDLRDLQYWVIKRKSGEHVKWSLIPDGNIIGKDKPKPIVGAPTPATNWSHFSHLGEMCEHYLTNLPVFETPDMRLFICDAPGARRDREKVDFLIDGGDVISEYLASTTAILSGDRGLAGELASHVQIAFKGPRVLKIAWGDRKAPYLAPSFWVELAKKVKGDVMTACQGGHGRSGTSLVCLMMVLNLEYGAKDAIIHLRAMHCARAIEGADQHAYINEVAKFLGRPEDADEIHQVTNFKEAFLSMTHPSSKPYQDRLKLATKIEDKKEVRYGGQV